MSQLFDERFGRLGIINQACGEGASVLPMVSRSFGYIAVLSCAVTNSLLALLSKSGRAICAREIKANVYSRP